MEQMEKLRADFKMQIAAFKMDLGNYQANFNNTKEKRKLGFFDGYLNKTTFWFWFVLLPPESITQWLEDVFPEKPSRELSFVKTKLQEVIFWARQS